MQKPLPSDAIESDSLTLCSVEFTHKYTAITVSWKSSFVKNSNYMSYYTVYDI